MLARMCTRLGRPPDGWSGSERVQGWLAGQPQKGKGLGCLYSSSKLRLLPAAVSLLEGRLRYRPERRLTAQAARQHPYMQRTASHDPFAQSDCCLRQPPALGAPISNIQGPASTQAAGGGSGGQPAVSAQAAAGGQEPGAGGQPPAFAQPAAGAKLAQQPSFGDQRPASTQAACGAQEFGSSGKPAVSAQPAAGVQEPGADGQPPAFAQPAAGSKLAQQPRFGSQPPASTQAAGGSHEPASGGQPVH